MNQFSGQCPQAIVMAISPTVLNREVPALDQTRFTQALPKPRHTIGVGLSQTGTEETYHRHRRLLTARRDRPRRRTAERGYEFPPSNVDCHVTLPRGHAHAMEGRYHAFSERRSKILRCESLEPPMSQMGLGRVKTPW
jgi:hypothetical protein